MMAERLEIRTFGGLIIQRGERLIESGLPHKAKALLVYLASTGRAHPRPVLADLLWDQGSEQQLMNNMRVLLSNLRRELGPYVAITRESVAFDRAAPHWLDTAELAQDLAKNLSRRDAVRYGYDPASPAASGSDWRTFLGSGRTVPTVCAPQPTRTPPGGDSTV